MHIANGLLCLILAAIMIGWNDRKADPVIAAAVIAGFGFIFGPFIAKAAVWSRTIVAARW